MCYILPQSMIFLMDYSTTIIIIPQRVAFLLQSVVLPMDYPTTNCSNVL